MTLEEIIKAKEHFWYGISHDIFSEPVTSYAKTAVEALEKQMPKKVKIEKYAPTRCNCGFEFSIHYGDGYYSIPFELKTPYCRNCGQALDWSEKE